MLGMHHLRPAAGHDWGASYRAVGASSSPLNLAGIAMAITLGVLIVLLSTLAAILTVGVANPAPF